MRNRPVCDFSNLAIFAFFYSCSILLMVLLSFDLTVFFYFLTLNSLHFLKLPFCLLFQFTILHTFNPFLFHFVRRRGWMPSERGPYTSLPIFCVYISNLHDFFRAFYRFFFLVWGRRAGRSAKVECPAVPPAVWAYYRKNSRKNWLRSSFLWQRSARLSEAPVSITGTET